jgi:hypothetical protein
MQLLRCYCEGGAGRAMLYFEDCLRLLWLVCSVGAGCLLGLDAGLGFFALAVVVFVVDQVLSCAVVMLSIPLNWPDCVSVVFMFHWVKSTRV